MSWLSSLIDHIKQTESIDFVLSDRLAGKSSGLDDLVPDETYISVRIARLRLPYTRTKVVDKVYGVVHAFAHFSSAEGKSVELAATTMPSRLANVDSKNLQNVISIDKLVIGPTPWSGGDFDLEMGLFSVVSENLAGPFLETMSKLSETVGVAFAAAAKPYVDIVKLGVEKMTSAAGTVMLEVGLDQTFSKPTPGSYALVAENVAEIDISKLSLDPIDGKLLLDGHHYTRRPYVVFTIEATDQRSDWGQIPELSKAYAAIKDAIRANDQTRAEQAFTSFSREARLSPDLLKTDGERLIAKVKAVLDEAFGKAERARQEPGWVPPEFDRLELYKA